MTFHYFNNQFLVSSEDNICDFQYNIPQKKGQTCSLRCSTRKSYANKSISNSTYSTYLSGTRLSAVWGFTDQLISPEQPHTFKAVRFRKEADDGTRFIKLCRHFKIRRNESNIDSGLHKCSIMYQSSFSFLSE